MEQLVKEKNITIENEALTLRYILTRSDRTKSYGAKIEKRSSQGGYEEAQQEDLFPNYPQANRFLLSLAQHSVTPVSFPDIVEDYMCL